MTNVLDGYDRDVQRLRVKRPNSMMRDVEAPTTAYDRLPRSAIQFCTRSASATGLLLACASTASRTRGFRWWQTLVLANADVNLQRAHYLDQMGKIKPPRPNSPSRFNECQEAIEAQLQELIAEAITVGWTKAETLAAVIEVADNLSLGMGEDEELAAILAAVKRMR